MSKKSVTVTYGCTQLLSPDDFLSQMSVLGGGGTSGGGGGAKK
jgi:hypothetical protein